MPPKKKETVPPTDLLSQAMPQSAPADANDIATVGGELALVDPQGVAVIQKTPAERAVLALDSSKTERELKKLVKSTKDIIEIKDKDGRAQVHAAAQALLKKRTGMKAIAEQLTEDAKAYTSAVKAEAARLTLITSVEEDRLFKLRDDYDAAAKIEEERLARIEAERIERINTQLSDIRARGERTAKMTRTAADAQIEHDSLAAVEITEEFFGDKYNQAVELKRSTLEGIQALLDERIAAEAAEQERIKAEEEARRQLEEDQANVRKAMQAQRDKAAREETERKRVEGIRAQITVMQMKPMAFMGKPAADIEAAIDDLSAFEPDESFAEFADESRTMRDQAVMMLKTMHAQQVMIEKAAAIVAEQAKKDAEAAAEQARITAEAKAIADEAEAASAAVLLEQVAPDIIEEVPAPLTEVVAEIAPEVIVEAEVENDPDFREVANEVARNDGGQAVVETAPYTMAEETFLNAVRALYEQRCSPAYLHDLLDEEISRLTQVAA